MLSKLRILTRIKLYPKLINYNFCNKTEVQNNKTKLLKSNLMGSKLRERYDNLDDTSLEELKEKAKIFDFTLLQDNKSNINKMELIRNVDDWNVRILFNAPKFVSRLPGEMEKEEILKNYVENASIQIPVYFLLKKDNKPKGFFISGMIDEGQLNIEYINCTENVEEYHKLFVRAYIHRDHQAFDFDILDQELQDRFVNFINELGIEQGVIDLIEEISESKEKSLYANWYNTFKNILTEKH
jgi:hypothetical protein